MSTPILVTRPTLPPFEEYTSLIHQVWENRWLTNSGPLHEQLKSNLKAYLNVQNLSLFTNGHSALEIAIHALNLPRKSEVITTPYTFASTTHAIVRNGLKPVFCDISYKDYNIDVTKIEELITDKTSAIIPVHVYGTPCDVDAIDKIARAHNLKVIYDAAHAFGVEIYDDCQPNVSGINRIKGRSITSYGDASMLSFHATKVFNTVEGGAIVSKDAEVIAAAERYRNFGMEGQEDYIEVGTNAKMSEFHAAMGIANLHHVDESIAARKVLCDRYDELLSDVRGIKLLERDARVKSNYAYYPVVIEDAYPLDRDALCAKLAENGVFARKYFYPIVTEFSCYRDMLISSGVSSDASSGACLGVRCGEESVALDVSRRVLSLPLYDTMEVGVVDRICEIMRV